MNSPRLWCSIQTARQCAVPRTAEVRLRRRGVADRVRIWFARAERLTRITAFVEAEAVGRVHRNAHRTGLAAAGADGSSPPRELPWPGLAAGLRESPERWA
jgi:hypothetical protein